jgi:hypothetical protein
MGVLQSYTHTTLPMQHVAAPSTNVAAPKNRCRGVAVQVDPFESKTFLKPGDHVSGSRVETRRFQAMGQLDATLQPPTTA